jgi:2-alkyl-3-oxoalkanoate reductase
MASASRTALVTGATGLVGSHIVERLVADGWNVRALVRDEKPARWLEALGADLVKGDVLDKSSLVRAAGGCDVIHHTAAAIIPREGGWEAYRLPNVEGTGHVIEAAGWSGARLVHLSSVAVYGPQGRFRSDGLKTDEDTGLTPLPEGAWYARSKRESEQLVMEAAVAGRIWATAIRPCVIYGRRDRQFTPRAARLFSTGFAPSVKGGRPVLSLVHAANVADAAVRAAEYDPATGRSYNAANDEPVTLAEFVRLASVGLGRVVRRVPVPLGPSRWLAGAIGKVLGLLGRGGSFGLASSLDFLARDNPFSSERARRELGWAPPVPASVGVPDAFDYWARTAGKK